MRRARLLAIGLVCLVASTLGAVDVGAVDQPVVSVRLGYQGVVRAAEWMPVDVLVTARDSAVDGTVEVQVEDSSEGYLQRQNFTSQPNPFGPTYTTVYQVPVKVAARSSQQLRTYVLTDVQNPTISVRFISAGETASSPVTATGQTTKLLVGVLSNRPTAFDALGGTPLPGNLTPRVVPLSVDSLPSSTVLLRAFDLLIIDDFPTTTLTADQRTALADYVSAGGSLVLGTGASLTTQGLPASLLPMAIAAMTTLPQVAALPGISGLTVVTGRLHSGSAWLAEGNQPLVVEWPVGFGIVTFATFSFAAPPMASWSGTSSLLRQVAIRSVLRGAQSDLAPTSLAPGQGPITGPRGFQGSVTKRSWFLMPDLGSSPPVSPPPVPPVGLLVVGSALLAGILIFLLLRRLGRQRWLWFIAPILVLIPVGLIWITSPRAGGADLAINQHSITYFAQGSGTGYRETFTAVRPSQTGDYRVILPVTETIAPFAVGYGPGDTIGVGIRIDSRTPSVDLLRVSKGSVRGYVTERTVPPSGLSAQLSLANGRIQGQVKNASSTHFIDPVVLAGGSIIRLGDLPPGASVPVDGPLTTTTNGGGGELTSLQIYPNSANGSGPQADTRISLLQLILGEYDTPSAQLAPTLLAWTPGVVEPITISGQSPRMDTQNAIVMPLAISQVSAGPLPAAFFAPRLVDATGHVDLSQYGAAIDQGSVTYEFSLPLASRARVNGLTVTHALVPGPIPPSSLVGPNGQPLAIAQVWDWSTSAWVPISLTDSGTDPLPEGALQAGTGLVRLRLESANGSSFRIGALWLDGVVAPEG